jgi:Ice-binding-like/Bacterial Ig-like domain
MRSSKSSRLGRGAALLALSFTAACGGLGSSPAPAPPVAGAPTVLSTAPVSGARNVPLGGTVSATFSKVMAPATLTGATFTLTSGTPAVQVQGTVVYANSTVVFWPAAPLTSNDVYTATISSAATSVSGEALTTNVMWRFDTDSVGGPPSGVNLGLAGTYAVLAKSGISTEPNSAVTGDLGISPAAATSITGFSLAADPGNVFSTSLQVTGKIYAADYAVPTPSSLTTAVVDMQLAFTDAAGRAAGITDLGGGTLDRVTLAPGVYRWTTDLLVKTVVTLSGSATDIWILQVPGNLSMSNGALVRLLGGARSSNVFWQVGGLVDLGMLVQAEGIFLSKTSITMASGAAVNGRLLAQTAVTIYQGTVAEPSP